MGFITDLYQEIYCGWTQRQLSFVQHIESAFFSVSMLLCGNMADMFISSMFYRLSKVWTVIAAIGAPVLLFTVLPIIVSIPVVAQALAPIAASVGEWLLIGPWNAVLCLLLAAVIGAGLCWLLIRRAPIKAIKG